MAQIMVAPVSIVYNGKDAEHHLLDAREYGESLVGASKLYSTVVHYCVLGTVPKRNYKKEFNCYASPPRQGSFEYVVLISSITGELGLFNEIYKAGLSALFPLIVRGIKEMWTRPNDKVPIELAEVIKRQASNNHDLAMAATNGLVRANDNLTRITEMLVQTLPQLAESTRGFGRSFVSPVGSSCSSINQFANTNHELPISEPEADVIRGGLEMEVDDMQQFLCNRITEINVENGHCILDIADLKRTITGKISDPVLAAPDNIYTRALNNQTPLVIMAKPVKRNGVVQKLYVSDAGELE